MSRPQMPLLPLTRLPIPFLRVEPLDRTPHRNDIVDVFNVGWRDFSRCPVTNVDVVLLHDHNNLFVDAICWIDAPSYDFYIHLPLISFTLCEGGRHLAPSSVSDTDECNFHAMTLQTQRQECECLIAS